MGIGIVLMFWAGVLTTSAIVGSLVLSGTTLLFLRNRPYKRKRKVVIVAAFPYACVAFAGVWFLFYALVNSIVLDRDPGLGDSWGTPLPNGYALNMIDTVDQGTVYNPKSQKDSFSISSASDSVFGVRQLQVADNWILGARDRGYFEHMGQDSNFVDEYFALDTRIGHISVFSAESGLRRDAESHGVSLKMKPFAEVFHQYRTTWFDYAAVIILFAAPLIGFLLLVRWLWTSRNAQPDPDALDPGYLWNRAR